MRPEERLGELLLKKGLTISVAESCTGGLLAARITDVPGASSYFRGGFVAYQNLAKRRLVRVRRRTLERGGVSEEVTQALAIGCRRRLGTDLALGVTGMAGPGGGTQEIPVGTIFVAVDSSRGTRCKQFLFAGDRAANREQAVQAALRIAIEAIEAS